MKYLTSECNQETIYFIIVSYDRLQIHFYCNLFILAIISTKHCFHVYCKYYNIYSLNRRSLFLMCIFLLVRQFVHTLEYVDIFLYTSDCRHLYKVLQYMYVYDSTICYIQIHLIHRPSYCFYQFVPFNLMLFRFVMLFKEIHLVLLVHQDPDNE